MSGGKRRAALVGCGNIGARYDEAPGFPDAVYTHAGMYSRLEDFELVCAMDADPVRLEEFGRRWGVRRLYGDLEEMLRIEWPDIVSIATPDEAHAEQVRTVIAARTSRLVFTEKPLAQDTGTAMELLRLAREAGVTIIVDYVRRFDLKHNEIREFLAKGELGAIQNVAGHYVRGLRHNGCQLINLLRFFFGKVRAVQASPFSTGGSMPGDDSLDAFLSFEGGSEAVLLGSDRQGYGFSVYELDIIGRQGRLRLSATGECLEYGRVARDERFTNFSTIAPATPPWSVGTYGKAMLRGGQEFAAILAGEARCPVNAAREAVDDLAVIEAIRESRITGRHVVVAYPET